MTTKTNVTAPVTQDTAKKFAAQGRVKRITGTIRMPEMAGLRLILALASESGQPDSDLYTLLDTKWRAVKAELKGWNQRHIDFKLGNIKDTAVNSDIWVEHMLCLTKENKLDEKALDSCLKKVVALAKAEKASVHVSELLTTAFPELKDKLQTFCVENGVSVMYYAEAK